MTDERPSPEATAPIVGVDIEPWCRAVRRSSAAVGIVALPSMQYVELSDPARKLLGPGHTAILDSLAPADRNEVAAIARATASGAIDGSEVRRRLWHRQDGSVVEVAVRARAIRLPTESFGLWVAREVAARTAPSLATRLERSPLTDAVQRLGPAAAYISLDPGLHVYSRTNAGDRLNETLAGLDFFGLIPPSDVAHLLFAFAGATTGVDASSRLVVGAPEGTRAVDVRVRRNDDRSWTLRVAVSAPGAPALGLAQRARELADVLYQFASHLQASALVATSSHAKARGLGVIELSERQREIVTRLARGERVGTIATKMYLSPNTVRNHLSVVFKKFGVHSQVELLDLLHGREDDIAPMPP